MKMLGKSLIIAVSVGIVVFAIWRSRGESLYGCQLRLSSPKDAYKAGEDITLIAEIGSDRQRTVGLSSRLSENVFLWNTQNPAQGEIHRGKEVRYGFGPGNPLRFTIVGRIVTDDKGNEWVDFGEFGKGPIKEGLFPELRFSARPYRVRASDSRDWGPSNSLQLRLE